MEIEEVVVRPYDWVFHPKMETSDGDIYTAIHIWALDRQSFPYLIRVTDFPLPIYVELPGGQDWNQDWSELMNELLGQPTLKHSKPLSYNFVTKKKTYYYWEKNAHPMLHLTFRNQDDLSQWTSFFRRKVFNSRIFGELVFRAWETDIKPLTKYLTQRKLKYCGWLKAFGNRVEEENKVSKLANEYLVDWNQVFPIPDNESQTWATYPRIVCFDIETYSDNCRRMPDQRSDSNVVSMVSCVYQVVGKPETRKSIGIVLGDCHEIPKDVLPDTEIIRVPNEYELTEEFWKLIDRYDPEIISGYNIDRYDYEYLHARRSYSSMKYDREEKWGNMTRMSSGTPMLKEDNWSSSGAGQMKMTSLFIEGRISIDLYTLIKRDYKLEKYNLDFVSKYFLPQSGGKHDVSAAQMFKIYEQMQAALQAVEEDNCPVTRSQLETAKAEVTRVLAYCIQDSELVMNLIDKLNIWISLNEMANVLRVTMTDQINRGQQVRCISQLYDLVYWKGYVIDHRESPGYDYQGGFVGEPVPGIYDWVICLDFNSLYPSLIMAYNICWSTLIPNELIDTLPPEMVHTFEFDQEEEINQEPEEEDENLFGEQKRKNKKKNVEKHFRHYKFQFLKQPQGLLPALVQNLVQTRKATNREKIKYDEDSLVYQILDKRQLALKVSANSFYGFLGIQKNGKMPLLEGAMSITYLGRRHINEATDFIVQKYGAKFVYSDTDSSMVKMPQIQKPEDCQYWGELLAQEISGWEVGDPLPGYGYRSKAHPDKVHTTSQAGVFPPPLKMEFEKAMRILCLCKKKYAYFKIEPDGSYKWNKNKNRPHIEKKGILLARRGNPPFLCRVYENVLYNVLEDKPFDETIWMVIAEISKLLNNDVSAHDLVAIRELGEKYKNKNFFMSVFSTKLCQEGNPVSPGERLGFVIVKSDNPKELLGNKMRLIEKYVTDPKPDPIDTDYYLEKVFSNPIDQLFEVGYRREIRNLKRFRYRPLRSTKTLNLQTPLKLIYRALRDGIPLQTIIDNLKRCMYEWPTPAFEEATD